MRDVLYLDRIEQAETLLKPQRIEVLRQLALPRSCTEVGAELSQTPQRVYYHVRRLVDADLVEQVAERRVRGVTEGIYRAAAAAYWLSPALVGRLGLPTDSGALGLGHLLDLVEQVQRDIAGLGPDTAGRPSVGVSAEIRVRPEQRQEFLADLSSTLEQLLRRYGGAEGEAFRLALACYPLLVPEGEDDDDREP